MTSTAPFVISCFILLLLGGCAEKAPPSPTTVADVDTARIIAADQEPGNWLAHGRTYDEQRFSQLRHIDRNNVAELGLAWEFDTGSTRGLEATPVVVDGVMYTTSTWSRVIALNAKTGALIWEHDPGVQRSWAKRLCCDIVNRGVAVWKGAVYFGTLDGYLVALDAATGPFEHEELALAAPTWDPGSNWKGVGGTVWDSMAYDPELNLLYVGTGNGSPWSQYVRSPSGGDNLYLSSILALDPDTGRMVWHYQSTPGDTWDFTATQHMILADLKIDGKQRKVLMQAPKNGFFYVLDRATGAVISAEKYVFANWASHVDLATGRPVPSELGDYSKQERYVFPSAAGGHNWQPMSYNPGTGLVYIPARDTGWIHNETGDRWFTWGADNIDELSAGQNIPSDAGYLKAWNPVKQELVWQMQFANIWNGGSLSTGSGLVFHGTATGHFYALDGATGEILLYVINCGGCHGMYGSTPMLPDLRRQSLEKHALFREIVLDGLLEPQGMSSFAGDLTPAEVDAVQAYVVNLSREVITWQNHLGNSP